MISTSSQTHFIPLGSNYGGRACQLEDWYEEVEDLEDYRAGGYHPVRLGDEFSGGRYRIMHKLGHGSYSTVWLARDHHVQRYVSIKIMTADSSERSTESQILRALHQNHSNHPGQRFVPVLHDSFQIEGPNGVHRCLVGEVVGPTITDLQYIHKCELLPLNVAHRVTAQLALGLSYIHSRGVIHGGKLVNLFIHQLANSVQTFTLKTLH